MRSSVPEENLSGTHALLSTSKTRQQRFGPTARTEAEQEPDREELLNPELRLL